MNMLELSNGPYTGRHFVVRHGPPATLCVALPACSRYAAGGRAREPGWLGIGRRMALVGILLACWPLLAAGQITVALHIPSSKVLLYEPVIATVTLLNHSGRMVVFDTKPECARVRFNIEMGEGKLIPLLSEAPLLTGVELMPGEKRALQFNLPRLYAIQSVGLYKVRAVVDMGAVAYASAAVYLEVARGFELRRLMAGIPDDPQVSRTYVLEYLQKDTSEENLYLRIEDETAQIIYGMFNLGRIVRVRMPDLQVDESGNVHVLFQTPGASYVHVAFTPYGVALMTKRISGGGRQVEMVRLPNGRISVTGDSATLPQTRGVRSGPVMDDGPVTKIKKATGGLFGKPGD